MTTTLPLLSSLAALRRQVGTFAESPEFRQVEDAVSRIASQSLWQEIERRMLVLAAENNTLRLELKAAKDGRKR